MFNVFSMDEYTREMVLAEKAYQIGMAEVEFMESMLDAKLKINIAKSEQKVMMEATSSRAAYSDLAYYYIEASKEHEQEQEGIFAKIKRVVSEWFIKAWNTVQKWFTKQDTEAYKALMQSNKKVKLPFDINIISDLEQATTGAEKFVANPAKGIATVVLGAVGIVGTGAGIHALWNKFKNRKKETEVTQGQAVKGFERFKDLLSRFNKLLERFHIKKVDGSESTGAPNNAGNTSDGNNTDEQNKSGGNETDEQKSFLKNIKEWFSWIFSVFKNLFIGKDDVDEKLDAKDPKTPSDEGGTDGDVNK